MPCRPLFVVLAAVMTFLSGAPVSYAQPADRAESDLTVMTFNIRYGTAGDEGNLWDDRHEQVIKAIKAADPDLLGTQEVLDFQAEYLNKNLEGYAFHGVGRDDGKTKGEYAGIHYRKDRFELLDAGHFWLSESPEVPGSVSWDSSLTRMVSWVRLRDRKAGRELVFFNTHWDHRGRQARLESARLMRKKIQEIAGAAPVIVTGDFNTTEIAEPYAVLVSASEGGGEPLIDAYRQAHPEPGAEEATSNGGFRGRREGRRIDWILHTSDFQTSFAKIDQEKIDDRYPSDHYPVIAKLQWKAGEGE